MLVVRVVEDVSMMLVVLVCVVLVTEPVLVCVVLVTVLSVLVLVTDVLAMVRVTVVLEVLLREYTKQHQEGAGGGQNSSNFGLLARLPLKLGPEGLGTLMGESGVKFRIERHPPRGRETFIRPFLCQKIMFSIP